ncbi:GTPase domain-containing protein [Xenorhabdus bovienii]|uniref:GTPase domain-containing protein n=1 Tax=Xenorhabdus bovienii TaxID=40576 RepID=UPI0023B208EF|nr:GTPase domain-containing protein [Xenorhabdus bovienii]MDE9446713.1 GTPase domain-containing protein [Xenorhabdus bovienii]MDE9463278.1 GTPase domain-containing protein [Xenorhabdus bovienii]MDE9471071.1 GTPase domain-containing protein [Xenorhabdus bovienii]
MFVLDIKGAMKSPSLWCFLAIVTVLGSFKPKFISDFEPYVSRFVWLILAFIFIYKIIKLKKIWFKQSELEKIYSFNGIKKLKKKHVKTVVVLGLSRVGKTTFINSLFNDYPAKQRTQNIQGRLKKLKINQHVVFVDVSGDSIPQIYQALQIADVIIIMLDHSDRDNSSVIQKRRINKNNIFIKGLCNFIQGYNGSSSDINIKKIQSLFLFNKSDLWGKKESNLHSEYKESINLWRETINGNVSYINYTNNHMAKSIKQECHNKNVNDVLEIIERYIDEK